MTQPQPNDRAAALRMALDLLDKLDADLRVREAAQPDENENQTGFREGLLFARLLIGDAVTDTLQDQLLDAGGFLGDAPEPEEKRVTVRGWTVVLSEPDYAWFERDSDGTGGGLWFEGGELADYDGVACLPSAVADGIRALGLIVPADME